MMRRSRAHRFVAGVQTFFVLLALAAPARAYVCPMHAVSAASAIVAHAGMSHHRAPAEDRTPPQCACVGDCDAVASAHALPSAPDAGTVVIAARAAALAHFVALPRAARVEFALPFANGPPLGA